MTLLLQLSSPADKNNKTSSTLPRRYRLPAGSLWRTCLELHTGKLHNTYAGKVVSLFHFLSNDTVVWGESENATPNSILLYSYCSVNTYLNCHRDIHAKCSPHQSTPGREWGGREAVRVEGGGHVKKKKHNVSLLAEL